MLKTLLSGERFNHVEKVETWKDAIALAAKPLLEDGSIEYSYINAMIDAVETYGPYIVLDEGFALPHAQGVKGVNQLSMSLLTVEKEVDLLGKPVRAFLVLAAPDSSSHLGALRDLSDVLTIPGNLDTLKNGDWEAIWQMIDKKT